jgi:hypothetical protein
MSFALAIRLARFFFHFGLLPELQYSSNRGTMKYFTDTDLTGLWSNKEKAAFCLPMPDSDGISALERRLCVKLPESYLELMTESQNGGLLKRCAFPVKDAEGNIVRHVVNSYIASLGRVPAHEQDPIRFPEHDALRLFDDVPKLIAFGSNIDTLDSFVLNYLECGSDGEPTVAWIDRKARRGRDGEPVFDEHDWRNINEKFYWSLITLAPTFADYVKGLVVMPKLPAFDFKALKTPLKQAVKQSFRGLVQAHGQEGIVAYGLYIDDLASMVADAANTRDHLENNVASFPNERDFYTFATTEWKYEGLDYGLELFDDISKSLTTHSASLSENKRQHFRNKLLDICVDVLRELKSDRFFDKEYSEAVVLTVNISNDDISAAKARTIRQALS